MPENMRITCPGEDIQQAILQIFSPYLYNVISIRLHGKGVLMNPDDRKSL